MPACNKCGEEIRWAVTKNGKNMPVDSEPATNGKFLLEPVVVLGAEGQTDKFNAVWIGENDPYTGERFACHFDTCAAKEGRSQ